MEAKAERIIAEELKRLKWKEGQLKQRQKGDADKLAIAARLRRPTTLTVRQIAERLHTGGWKNLNNKLYLRSKKKAKGGTNEKLWFDPFDKLEKLWFDPFDELKA